MKILTTLLFTLVSFTTFAQTHSEFLEKANKLYSEKAYAESAKTFAAAFKVKEGNSGNYYNAACSAALAGQEKQAFDFLKKSMQKGWTGYSHMQQDSDLASLRDKNGWEPIAAIITEYEAGLDKDLMAKLDTIYIKDQTLRKLWDDAEKRFGRESQEFAYFLNLIAEQDKINELAVTKIIDKYGWPSKNLVGGKGNNTVFMVVQHAKVDVQEKYLPLLHASVKKGESRGSQLALLEDRIEMYNERPQVYGSQIRRNKETDKWEVYNLKDPKNVDKRRAEVGLGPIADYVKRWDIVWK